MKAAVLFTQTSPILILTSSDSLAHPELLRELEAKSITRFIACEVDIEAVRMAYGSRYRTVMEDRSQQDILRVLDVDGPHILNHFSMYDLGDPQVVELGHLQRQA